MNFFRLGLSKKERITLKNLKNKRTCWIKLKMAALAAPGPHMTHGHHFQAYPSVSMGPIWGFKVCSFSLGWTWDMSKITSWALLVSKRELEVRFPGVCYSRGKASFCFSQTRFGGGAKKRRVAYHAFYAFPRSNKAQLALSKIFTQNAAVLWVYRDPKTTSTVHWARIFRLRHLAFEICTKIWIFIFKKEILVINLFLARAKIWKKKIILLVSIFKVFNKNS